MDCFLLPSALPQLRPALQNLRIPLKAGLINFFGLILVPFPFPFLYIRGASLKKISLPFLLRVKRRPSGFLRAIKLLFIDTRNMGLLDFIQTADPRKVRAVEVQKGADQVTSATAAEVPVLTEERQEDVAPEDAYLNLADPDEDAIAVRQGEERVVSEQPKKVKRRRLAKQSDALPAKKLRTDHPSLTSGTGGKTLANLEQIMPEGSHFFGFSFMFIYRRVLNFSAMSRIISSSVRLFMTKSSTYTFRLRPICLWNALSTKR
ncbi:hypothetical protein Tco_0483537 [Tanacetum coccineum]